MQTMRWTNPSLPQTLQIGVFLLYFDAFWAVLGALGGSGGTTLISLLFAGLYAASAWGIANEKKVWYWAGVVISGLGLVWIVTGLGRADSLLDIRFLLAIVFPIAQFVALIHQMSRSYVKVWFN